MKHSVTARAYGTVANQPTFDGGGFPIRVVEVLGGKSETWETLYDEVRLQSNDADEFGITIVNEVEESNVGLLAANPECHTGGRVLLAIAKQLAQEKKSFNLHFTLIVRKGLSLKGTGLGSSGATPAATLKAFEVLCEKTGIPLSLSNHEKVRILKEADFGVPDNSIPAYFGGLVLIEQKSDGDLSIQSLNKDVDFGLFVLVTPKGFGIKTQDARCVLQGKKPPAKGEDHQRAMIKAFLGGDTLTYGQEMERVHEWFVTPRSRLYPQNGKVYEDVAQAGKEAGAFGVTISGSGPTLLAIVSNEHVGRVVGKAMQRAFEKSGFESVARLVDIESEGAQIIPGKVEI